MSDPLPEVHYQIADNTGMTAPNVAIWLVNNRFFVNLKYNTSGTNTELQVELTNSQAALGEWTDWVIYYLPATDNSGIVEVYRNGVQVYRRVGPNANVQNGSLVPSRYPKVGIYKWRWNTPVPGGFNPNQRVLFVDEIRYGGDSSKLADFIYHRNPVNPHRFHLL